MDNETILFDRLEIIKTANARYDLEHMELYLPAERKQCEMIWKPIYDEYRRIGYRLKQDEQLKLF